MIVEIIYIKFINCLRRNFYFIYIEGFLSVYKYFVIEVFRYAGFNLVGFIFIEVY